jgi:hypothetical protein
MSEDDHPPPTTVNWWTPFVRLWRRLSMHPWMRPFTEWRVFRRWERAGRPVPAPPIVKQRIVKAILRESGVDTVVETGTFTGDMVAALVGRASRIVSVELDDTLYERAVRRFASIPTVELLHGDSALLLPRVVEQLAGPALFWLDGHYAGSGTARTNVASPISEEVAALLNHPASGHVVLIDDARYFTGEDGYPTVDALRGAILARQPEADFVVKDDIIHWTSRPPATNTALAES